MPSAPLRRCLDCHVLTRSARCPEHEAAHARSRYVSRFSRCRFYWSRSWRRTRRGVLAERPLCEDCQQHGRVEPAVEVHHTFDPEDFPQLAHDERTLTALCKSCHSRRPAGLRTGDPGVAQARSADRGPVLA